MQFGLNWLKPWLKSIPDAQQLVEQLPLYGFEVASLTTAAPGFTGVRVGKVLEAKQHPNADKLRVCRVDDGSEVRQIVCGAHNAREGITVAVSVPGAVLPGDFTIKVSQIRGEESHGMMCSARELGLGEDHDGIIELDDSLQAGQDIREALQLDEQILELEITPNRGDCLSIRGISREISTIFSIPRLENVPQKVAVSLQEKRDITLSEPQACPAYYGRVIRLARPPGKSPDWMAYSLQRAGLRPVNLWVDITNYVMLETGQPLHAFDNSKLQGNIDVRFANKGESIELLNDQKVDLATHHLLISDEQGPIALGGVMGGAQSAVDNNTTEVFLEAAHFSPQIVAGRARELKLTSDACYRFERSVDPQAPLYAIEKACELLEKIYQQDASFGDICQAKDDTHMPKQPEISVEHEQMNKLSGIELPEDFCISTLQSLGFDVKTTGTDWKVTPPSWRMDVELNQDILEELTRLYGLQKLPDTLPLFEPRSEFAPETDIAQERIEDHLVALGYQEMVNYSFISSKEYSRFSDRRGVKLLNPISEDMEVMRANLYSSLLRALDENYRHQMRNLRAFETGLSYQYASDEPNEKNIIQTSKIAIASVGLAQELHWSKNLGVGNFFDIKGDIESIFQLFGLANNIDFIPLNDHPGLHPGRSASIEHKGKQIGIIGEIHPTILQHYSFADHRPIIAELTLDEVLCKDMEDYKSPSRLPGASRDFAFIVDKKYHYSQFEKAIRTAGGPFLQKVVPFDIFADDSMPENHQSIAVRLFWNNPKETLSDKQILHFSNQVVQSMECNFQANLRHG